MRVISRYTVIVLSVSIRLRVLFLAVRLIVLSVIPHCYFVIHFLFLINVLTIFFSTLKEHGDWCLSKRSDNCISIKHLPVIVFTWLVILKLFISNLYFNVVDFFSPNTAVKLKEHECETPTSVKAMSKK